MPKKGVRIRKVEHGSLAENAGLEAGDVEGGQRGGVWNHRHGALDKDADGWKLIHSKVDVNNVYGNNRLYFAICLRLPSPDLAAKAE